MENEIKHFRHLEGNEKLDKKRCTKCGDIKPLTEDFWNRSKRMESGFFTMCKECKYKTNKKYFDNNKALIAEKNQKPEYVYRHIRSQASKRSIKFELTFEEFKKLWGRKCYYCGGETIGWLDRFKNDKDIGYTKDNAVPACQTCNRMKSDLELENFVEHIKKILSHLKI